MPQTTSCFEMSRLCKRRMVWELQNAFGKRPKPTWWRFCPFEAAIPPVPAAAAPLGRDSNPARSKRRRQDESGSEDEDSGDPARPASYRKTEDRKKLNPLAAWLLFDKDRFCDRPRCQHAH